MSNACLFYSAFVFDITLSYNVFCILVDNKFLRGQTHV